MVVVVVQVGAAETGGADGDLEVCWAGGEEEAGFLEVNVSAGADVPGPVGLPVGGLLHRVELRLRLTALVLCEPRQGLFVAGWTSLRERGCCDQGGGQYISRMMMQKIDC